MATLNLKDTIVNISKAAAYDILAAQVKELKQVIKDLIEVGELDDLEFTDEEGTEEFKAVLNKAKILSFYIMA